MKPLTPEIRAVASLLLPEDQPVSVPWAWMESAGRRLDAGLERGVRALAEVESPGTDGFRAVTPHRELEEVRLWLPSLLYERHVMFRLKAPPVAYLLPECLRSSKRFVRYGTYSEQWRKLVAAARVVGWQYAVQACSWGRYQVLGENWKLVGAPSPGEFAWAQFYPEGQWAGFVRYVRRVDGLAAALRAGDARQAKLLYNGPADVGNEWESKFVAAWESIGNDEGRTA